MIMENLKNRTESLKGLMEPMVEQVNGWCAADGEKRAAVVIAVDERLIGAHTAGDSVHLVVGLVGLMRTDPDFLNAVKTALDIIEINSVLRKTPQTKKAIYEADGRCDRGELHGGGAAMIRYRTFEQFLGASKGTGCAEVEYGDTVLRVVYSVDAPDPDSGFGGGVTIRDITPTEPMSVEEYEDIDEDYIRDTILDMLGDSFLHEW